jgi:poly(A) polymerase
MSEPQHEGWNPANVTRLPVAPRIVPRAEHNISRSNIGDYALKVLYRLRSAGFSAYLVGGSVRDLLLGREPKDFDVATDARPEQVRELFRNCRLIGRRFRLAHVHFGAHIVEVATFRAEHDPEQDQDALTAEGRILRDNVYGTIETDVWRRDFTVNALYYNVADFSVVDYVGGVDDVQRGQLRLLGDPYQRYREDPVRMLRAVRFAVKLGFTLHPDTAQPIFELGPLLQDIPPARLFDEILKLFFSGYAVQAFEMLREYRLFGELFPDVEECLAVEKDGFPKLLLARALEGTDTRIASGKPVTPAFLFAALLWPAFEEQTERNEANGVPALEAQQLAGDTVISRQIARIAVPRRFTLMTREIWAMQARLERRNGKRAYRLLGDARFRAGYDFLLLRAQDGAPALKELVDWWTEFQAGDEARRAELVRGASSGPAPAKHRRGRRRRNGSRAAGSDPE